MNAIDDDDFPRTFREIDIRNVHCRLEYERRKRFGFVYADHRGEIGGAMLDAQLASKVRLAKYMRDKIVKERRMKEWREEREARKTPPNNVCMFHRRQAE